MTFKTSLYLLPLFSAVLLVGENVRAQDTTNTIGNVSIASPTAASLGKYGDIPVSYNTGIPNIDIPIYTVQAGSLKLPISLSYHGSGLKVEEEAGWVGAGWSLNAGGMITRTVVGAPDDQGLGSYNICTNGYYSSYGYSNYLFIYEPGAIGVAYDGYWPDDDNFARGYKDGEPDLFTFNFAGYTGKFYFNDDRTPVLVPEEDFKISPDLHTGPGNYGFQGFIITTPDGVKYYFGMTGNDNTAVKPIEITTPATIQNGPAFSNECVSSWFLNKIVSADGMDSINFTYAQEQYSEYTVSMFPVSNVLQGGNLNPYECGYSLVKNFITGVRLTGITFPNGHITFNRAASPRLDLSGNYNMAGIADQANDSTSQNQYPSYALGSIQIANTSGFCKKDSLYFGYFQDNVNTLNGLFSTYTATYNIQSDTYRLRLDSVQEFSCDGTVSVPPYAFTYYPELVPRKLSFGVDHWGFYNGVTSNAGLIPTFSLSNSGLVNAIPGASRDSKWPAMRGGGLNSITYPTGGHTNFTFEPNTTFVYATEYTAMTRLNMSAGFDGHNGTLGDGGDNPDTNHLTSVGNPYMIIISNSSEGGAGALEILPQGSYSPAFSSGNVGVGQTDTFYTNLSAGNYWTELTKQNALAGYGVSCTINEMIPSIINGNDTIGGLRIKSITNYDGISPDSVTTNYSYTVAGGVQSSGILYSRPVYIQMLRNDVYGWIYEPIDGTPGCVGTANFYISPASITPMQTIQGNPIGYNEVDVSQPGNGHTMYLYYGSAYWNNIISDVCTRNITIGNCTTSIPNFPAPPFPYEPLREELQYMAHYNQAGKVLKDATYTPVYLFDSLTTPALKYISIPGLYSFTAYSLQSAKKVQMTVVSGTYDPESSGVIQTTSTVYYGSAFHHQPTRQVTTTSNGDSLATNTTYVLDLRIATCDAIPDSLPWFMNTVNADTSQFFTDIGVPIASNWQGRMDTLSNMRRHVDLARIQFINYRLRSFSDSVNLQASCYATALSSADTALKPVLRLQSEFNNIPVEVSSWRDSKLLHASFTKYDTSLSPVGFSYPDRTQLISLQMPSTSFTNAHISGNTLLKDSRYADESLYQFSSGNPQQVSPHDGVTVSYIWDYLNQEPIAKAVGTTSSQICYTSFETNGGGGWSVTGSTMNTSSAITGSQSYSISSGGIYKSGLNSLLTYIVSYWTTNSTSYAVGGSVVQGKTISINGTNWTYFEHTITGTGGLAITGSGYIDELRMYPQGAQMTTYTYTPMVGMTSQCDVDNRVTYYTYDPLGRLRYIKDQDGNILKTIEYHYSLSQTGGGGY